MTHKYLFILCLPASGSTLLWQILRTSSHVGFLPVEGQALAREILFNKQRWNPEMPVQWEKVKEKWEAVWDLTKPVLLEKSPPHLVRARQLEANFPDSYFVIMVRNPYAFCEGVKRRWKIDSAYTEIARFWVDWAGCQIDNHRSLSRALFFTYEELTDAPGDICQRLIAFMPELQKLYPERHFNVFEKTQRIENLNRKQIRRLTPDDMLEINGVLKSKPELMQYFHYEFLDNPLQE
jgi:hypothetical protein